jgi:hypothetical protein
VRDLLPVLYVQNSLHLLLLRRRLVLYFPTLCPDENNHEFAVAWLSFFDIRTLFIHLNNNAVL